MNFSSEAIALIDDIASRFGVAINWGNENILPILQDLADKYIRWEISTSTAWIVLSLIIELVLIFLIYFDIKKWDTLAVAVFSTIAAIASLVVIVFQIFDIIKCCTFPELQILEFLKEFIQSLGNHL